MRSMLVRVRRHAKCVRHVRFNFESAVFHFFVRYQPSNLILRSQLREINATEARVEGRVSRGNPSFLGTRHSTLRT